MVRADLLQMTLLAAWLMQVLCSTGGNVAPGVAYFSMDPAKANAPSATARAAHSRTARTSNTVSAVSDNENARGRRQSTSHTPAQDLDTLVHYLSANAKNLQDDAEQWITVCSLVADVIWGSCRLQDLHGAIPYRHIQSWENAMRPLDNHLESVEYCLVKVVNGFEEIRQAAHGGRVEYYAWQRSSIESFTETAANHLVDVHQTVQTGSTAFESLTVYMTHPDISQFVPGVRDCFKLILNIINFSWKALSEMRGLLTRSLKNAAKYVKKQDTIPTHVSALIGWSRWLRQQLGGLKTTISGAEVDNLWKSLQYAFGGRQPYDPRDQWANEEPLQNKLYGALLDCQDYYLRLFRRSTNRAHVAELRRSLYQLHPCYQALQEANAAFYSMIQSYHDRQSGPNLRSNWTTNLFRRSQFWDAFQVFRRSFSTMARHLEAIQTALDVHFAAISGGRLLRPRGGLQTTLARCFEHVMRVQRSSEKLQNRLRTQRVHRSRGM